MIGWNPNYNWTYEEYRRAVDKAGNTVTLDTEHADYNNEQQIVAWAKADGYKAEICRGGDSITITKSR